MIKYEQLSTSESSPQPKNEHSSKANILIFLLFLVIGITVWTTIPSLLYLENTTDIIEHSDQIPIQETFSTTPTTSAPLSTSIEKPIPPMSKSRKVVAAYFTSWSIYARAYNVVDMDATKLTHILYAFANLKPDGEVFLGDAWADTDKHFDGDSWNDEKKNLYGNFKQLGLLKKRNRNLKVTLSIGGWTWSTHFPTVAANPDTRKKFITSSINLLKDLGLDGLDEDAKNYVKLLKELRKALDNYSQSRNLSYKFLLTAAMPCGEDQYRNMDLKKMNKYLDIFYLMAYDFRGSWSSKTGHQSNLYGVDLSTDKAVRYYIDQGVDNDKIVIGMPMYGRAFQNTNGLDSPYNGIGEGTWEQGVYDYKTLPRTGSIEYFDDKKVACYGYCASKKEFITYDNPQVVYQKTDYIKRNDLRGVMFWEISGDFPTSNERSLLLAAYHGLGGKDALDQTSNHCFFPDSIYENWCNWCINTVV
ncbi:691_t:CDS:2 [Funneliformis mosseae]|uniref:chitinase n=1 Tax=Funneliformis mosseae TaxID=27381 RepID=A0A9N9GEN7_FUNMO|nr:691_t:CDS:2 [Funneliformis mosseae]